MKKLFSLAIVLTGLLTLFGCEISSVPRAEEFDGYLTVIVRTNQGDVEKHIGFMEEDELSVFDMLVENFEMNYTMFDFGPMITELEALVTSYGSFIQIIHNDSVSWVGAADIDYSDGDIIIFQLTWWDEDARLVRETLETMITNQIENDGPISQHYMVLIGLAHLDWIVWPYTLAYEAGDHTEAQLATMLLTAKAYGLDTPEMYEALMTKKTIAWPYATALTVMALSEGPLDATHYFNEFIQDLHSRDLELLDPDTLTMVALALQTIWKPELQPLVDEVNALIVDTLHVNTYGENTASYAHALLALMTMGHPLSADYDDEQGRHLLELLLEFYDDEGAFYWTQDASSPDLFFSTPQAFLALAMLDNYLNVNEEVHPFIFN